MPGRIEVLGGGSGKLLASAVRVIDELDSARGELADEETATRPGGPRPSAAVPSAGR
jgi:hypothetical protein